MLRVDQVTLSGDGGFVQLTRGHELRTVVMSLRRNESTVCRQTLLIQSFDAVIEKARRIAEDIQPSETSLFQIMEHLLAVTPFHPAELLPFDGLGGLLA